MLVEQVEGGRERRGEVGDAISGARGSRIQLLAGAIVALGQAKVWQSELDPVEIATGCSEFKDDRSAFEEQDFKNCVREMRPVNNPQV